VFSTREQTLNGHRHVEVIDYSTRGVFDVTQPKISVINISGCITVNNYFPEQKGIFPVSSLSSLFMLPVAFGLQVLSRSTSFHEKNDQSTHYHLDFVELDWTTIARR
jgi:hypothetical protein